MNDEQRRPDRFFGVKIAIMIAIFLAGLWLSAQAAARSLGYQPQLGPPWFFVRGYPVYRPFSFFFWYLKYHAYAPRQFDRALNFTIAGTIGSIAFSFYLALCRGRSKQAPSSHGTAAWATARELTKASLLTQNGVILGVARSGEYLRHDGPEHVLALAPTRSGKGVGIIIPTLLTWPGSVVVTDIKGENWGITSGFRQLGMKNRVLKFDPTSLAGGVRFNPLAEIRVGTPREVKDAQNVADILVDPQGTGATDHWAKTGHALLVGTILHLLYSELQTKDLTTVASFLSDPSRSIEETLTMMLTARHDPTFSHGWVDLAGEPTVTHPVVAAAARELLNKSENERSGVLSTAMALLGLYRDPIISRNTCVSDFMISDLMNHENPVSLYLVIPPSDLSRTRPLMRMILNQIGRTLTETMVFKEGKPVADYRHRLLLLLDEFPALGRLDFFEQALAFIAGYGLKALLIIQSLNQLKKAYGPDNSIMDNSHIRVAFTPNDDGTAERISRMLGQKTEIVENEGYSGNRWSVWLKNRSFSNQEIARPLMTPGEVSVLPYEDEIIFITGFPPILAKKLFYYRDKNFVSRLVPAPENSDVCRAEPVTIQAVPAGPKQKDGTADSATAAPDGTVSVKTTNKVETREEPAPEASDSVSIAPPAPAEITSSAEEREEPALIKNRTQVVTAAPEDDDDNGGLAL